MLKKMWLGPSLLITVFGLIMAGCSADWRNVRPVPGQAMRSASQGAVGGAILGGSATGAPGAAVGGLAGGVVGGVIGVCLAREESLVMKLHANGVRVIQIGEQVMLVLPTDRFFVKKTAVRNRNFDPVLNDVAALLGSFEKYSVKVAGYTDDIGPPLRNVALSRAQAQVVADYLWKRGIDTRLMTAVGYGDAGSIASNRTVIGQELNRRIEITLQLFVEPDDI